MERQWIQEAPGRPPGERARALFGRAVTCLGFCVMGLLAIPAAPCLVSTSFTAPSNSICASFSAASLVSASYLAFRSFSCFFSSSASVVFFDSSSISATFAANASCAVFAAVLCGSISACKASSSLVTTSSVAPSPRMFLISSRFMLLSSYTILLRRFLAKIPRLSPAGAKQKAAYRCFDLCTKKPPGGGLVREPYPRSPLLFYKSSV